MAKNDHLAAGGVVRAKLKRSGSKDYRDNGHSHISGTGRKRRYARVKKIQAVLKARGTSPRGGNVKPASPQHAERYTFTYGSNFKIGQSPYVNQAHHMLPDEAFTEKFLTNWNMRVLLAVPYNINEGTNIIFLPSRARDSSFHELPSHQGSHPKYTGLVVKDMKKIRNKLNKVKKQDAKHEDWSPPADIKDDLKKLEKKYWKLLTSGDVKPINEITITAPAKVTGRARTGRIQV